MGFASTEQALEYFASVRSLATQEDLALLQAVGGVTGSNLPLPKHVVIARLLDITHGIVHDRRPREATEAQRALVSALANEVGIERPTFITFREADAWIRYLVPRAREVHLARLSVRRGDVVRLAEWPTISLHRVHSIGRDGRIYFARSGSARPDELEVVERAEVRAAGK